jgi:integrase
MSQHNGTNRKPLTAVAVRQLTAPGRYSDGNGLYLVIDPSGARRWLLRIVVQRRRRDIGLGSARLVPLVAARDTAVEMRRLARDGGDPIAERRRRRAVAPTFQEAAKTVHAETVASWKNVRHAASWLTTLETYAFPVIGERPIDQVETADVLRVLAPIWLTKAETARRVRQRMRTVFDWARVAHGLKCSNPVDGVERGLPKQTDRAEHFAAMPYIQVAAFMKQLRERAVNNTPLLALEFLILTACRTNEVLMAAWDEFNLAEATWTIPAVRMKGREIHVVPLAERALAILSQMKTRGGKGLVFPGQALNKPLSNMVFLMTLRRMELAVTAHGFRSSFRDWAAEETAFPNFVVEKALAHTIENKVEAAYRRGDLLKKRRELMEAWATYCEAGPIETNVENTELELKLKLTTGDSHDDV